MIDLNDIAVFAAVTELGSFSKAARSLGMPVSTVSRCVSELETRLGATLLQRTTRKLTLTTQGRDYFDRCSEPLKHLYDAERVLTHTQRRPEGLLKLSLPVMLGDTAFLDFISHFLGLYPQIRCELFITNQYLDLVAENIDVAIRFGQLKSSSLVASKLGTTVRYLVAAPEYLTRRQAPREPKQLSEHSCVLLGGHNNETEWELVSGRKRVSVPVSGHVSSQDFRSVSHFTYRGHGIGLLPPSYCDEQLEAGTLVRLLPDWSSPPVSVHAVYPTRRFLPERVHALLQELKSWQGPFWSKA